jgi:hypothetical protein
MKISKTKSYKLNMGKYESAEVSTTVSVSDTDLFSDDELREMHPDQIRDELTAYVASHLEGDLDRELSSLAELSQESGSILFVDPKTPKTRRSTRGRQS